MITKLAIRSCALECIILSHHITIKLCVCIVSSVSHSRRTSINNKKEGSEHHIVVQNADQHLQISYLSILPEDVGDDDTD